ncbi:MAG: hypothetical protein O3C60_11430 [Planctomycetota bacterium]|nr:hypothetical protein [Planctomycetota bacterium]
MRLSTHFFMSLAVSIVAGSPAWAGPTADQLLPSSTKAMIAVSDVRASHVRWEETRFGELTANPILKPFIEDLQRQFREKLNETGERLGLTWEDVSGVHGGEVCLANIEPAGDAEGHALALIVDTTGHTAAANELADKIRASLDERGAKRVSTTQGSIAVQSFELPKKPGATNGPKVVMFHAFDRLVIGDPPDELQGIADRLQRLSAGQPTAGDELGSIAAYRAIMERCGTAPAAHAADARWFVEPFGYARIVRASRANVRRRGENRIKILQDQGFDAIQGIGGLIYLLHDQQDIQHRTFVHAPQDEKAVSGERFRGAARILDFSSNLQLAEPLSWIPADLSTHVTFEWRMQSAFGHFGSLVDGFFKEGFFEEVLQGMATDPEGPKLDIRNDFVAKLGKRVTVLVDHTDPITTDSERVLVALELQDDAAALAVQAALDRSLSTDPGARQVEQDGVKIWEFFEAEDEDLQIDGIESFDANAGAPVEEAEGKLWSHAAIIVAHGHLLMGSDIGIVQKVLKSSTSETAKPLGGAEDYQRLRAELETMGAGEDCARMFTRQDESLHPSYELWRQGKMPEAKSILGRLLNRMLAPKQKGVQRKQQIDGSQLPDYSVVAPYLGPSGLYVRAEANGWYVSGAFLPKEPTPLTSTGEGQSAETTASAGGRSQIESNTKQR